MMQEALQCITLVVQYRPSDKSQLYISLGGEDDPKVVLRGFDRLTIAPGASATFTAQICRRDLSNWDVASQNW